MNQQKPVLHMLMGLPGSGKSSFGRAIATKTGAVRLSSDEFRLLLFPKPTFSQEEHDTLYEIIDSMTIQLLKRGKSVVYDANLNRKSHRGEKYQLTKTFNVRTILWLISVEREIALSRRIEEQDVRLLPKGKSSTKMFERIEDIMELPVEEPYTEVDGTRIYENLYIEELLVKVKL